MSLIWRNIRQPLNNGHSWFGTRRVGIPAEDCTGLLTTAAGIYPNRLLRSYSPNIPSGTTISEDGSYTGQAPSYWELYVDGVFEGAYGADTPYPQPGALRRSGPSGEGDSFPERTILLGNQTFKVRSQNQLNMLLNNFMSTLQNQPEEEPQRKKVLMVQEVEVEKSFLSWLSEKPN